VSDTKGLKGIATIARQSVQCTSIGSTWIGQYPQCCNAYYEVRLHRGNSSQVRKQARTIPKRALLNATRVASAVTIGEAKHLGRYTRRPTHFRCCGVMTGRRLLSSGTLCLSGSIGNIPRVAVSSRKFISGKHNPNPEGERIQRCSQSVTARTPLTFRSFPSYHFQHEFTHTMSTEAHSDTAVKPDIAVTTDDTKEVKVHLPPSPEDHGPPPRRTPARSGTLHNQGQSRFERKGSLLLNASCRRSICIDPRTEVPIRPVRKLNHLWVSSLPLHCSPGEAAGDNGRVWKIYRDRVKDIEDDLLEGWNDTLNMLLVFVRLSGDASLITHSECRLAYSRRRALHSSLRCKSLS